MPKKRPDWLIEKTDVNAMNIIIEAKKVRGFEYWVLVSGDRHHDNPKCRQDLELKHLNQVKERNGSVIDIGDLHCAMQGKYDKRSNKSKVRPENQVDEYLDSLVECAVDFYKPYSHNFACMNPGNHEDSIKLRHETDLTQRTIDSLNDKTGSNIQKLGYTGWIRFQFKISTMRFSKVLWFTHGYGGGGPVTKDKIQENRQKTYIHADIMASAHVHHAWMDDSVWQQLNDSGKVTRNDILYIKTATYKDAYGKGVSGFEVAKGHGPRPLGAFWLRFWTEKFKGKRTLNVDAIRAK